VSTQSNPPAPAYPPSLEVQYYQSLGPQTQILSAAQHTPKYQHQQSLPPAPTIHQIHTLNDHSDMYSQTQEYNGGGYGYGGYGYVGGGNGEQQGKTYTANSAASMGEQGNGFGSRKMENTSQDKPFQWGDRTSKSATEPSANTSTAAPPMDYSPAPRTGPKVMIRYSTEEWNRDSATIIEVNSEITKGRILHLVGLIQPADMNKAQDLLKPLDDSEKEKLLKRGRRTMRMLSKSHVSIFQILMTRFRKGPVGEASSDGHRQSTMFPSSSSGGRGG